MSLYPVLYFVSSYPYKKMDIYEIHLREKLFMFQIALND